MSGGKWKRVSKSSCCPICGRLDWCLRSSDGSAAICARVSDGAVRQIGDAGWLHRLRTAERRPAATRMITISSVDRRTDLDELAERFRQNLKQVTLRHLGAHLGVSDGSLQRLGVGWNGRAYTFPMLNAFDQTVGIRLRLADGRKLSLRGGHEGLFIPHGLTTAAPLLICEGPTDTAAMLDLQFNAIGRPSCTGGTRMTADLIQRHRFAEVVILADGDEPGQRGAAALATVLRCYAPVVRTVVPPVGIKDGRAWVNQGARREDIEQAIASAPTQQLRFNSMRVGAG